MKSKAAVKRIIETLKGIYPDALCSLQYSYHRTLHSKLMLAFHVLFPPQGSMDLKEGPKFFRICTQPSRFVPNHLGFVPNPFVPNYLGFVPNPLYPTI